MKQCLLNRRSLALGGTVGVLFAGLAATPALADTSLIKTLINTPTSTSGCSEPQLSQPFVSVSDMNWYTLVPGETPDSFGGGGWSLTGGAHIVTTQLADGHTGSVLDLPSGSTAISPVVCVQSNYTSARALVRNAVGAEGVSVYVSCAGTSTWNMPAYTGQVNGSRTNWTLSDPLRVQPSNIPGWQLARFAFVPGGRASNFQIYNFYVDPRMH
jgi:hypothetical protein